MSLATAECSAAAARSIRPVAGVLRMKIMDYIRSCGNRGATCDETDAALGLCHQGTSARFAEMSRNDERSGYRPCIIDLGERRPTRSGRKAVVWFAVTTC
jgi:hypothetical protein